LQIEEPVACRYAPAFHFYATLVRVLGPTLIRDEVVQVGERRQKRLLIATGMVKRFHHEQFPVDGIMRLIQQGAGGWHLWVCEHGIPAGFFLPKPLPDALAIGWPRGGGDVVRKVA